MKWYSMIWYSRVHYIRRRVPSVMRDWSRHVSNSGFPGLKCKDGSFGFRVQGRSGFRV